MDDANMNNKDEMAPLIENSNISNKWGPYSDSKFSTRHLN